MVLNEAIEKGVSERNDNWSYYNWSYYNWVYCNNG